ncbi:tripartite tricarboxylate transporter TctB family protein [Candidatus Formimonas warabiya]|uniref:DUF1468 domain-containing protein n=1 Tax=Formimonas warabiya TaxID=1761012 RepID=A0A3G1KSL8_FORW1|nr:tripartite tricarboxylate transporter TctB family protein [Candidatus Formimonas warabiya]ATW25404.1 hypothetical protein DCMF_12030 [Candidatus Formimonas warabiya]
MAKRDVIAGLSLLLFGIFTGCMSLTYQYRAEYGPGPGFLPFWLSIALIVLSFALLIPALRSYRKGSPEVDKEHVMFTNPKIVFSCLGVIVLVAILLEKLGFVITVALAVTFFVKVVDREHPWKKSLLIGVVSTVLIYTVFKFGLGIILPQGVLPL